MASENPAYVASRHAARPYPAVGDAAEHHQGVRRMYDGARPDEYHPETGDWQGTCGRCVTNHDGWPPDTIGGILRCQRTRARRRADTTMWLPVAWLARRRTTWLDWKIQRHSRDLHDRLHR